jgi:hypothetical protein
LNRWLGQRGDDHHPGILGWRGNHQAGLAGGAANPVARKFNSDLDMLMARRAGKFKFFHNVHL